MEIPNQTGSAEAIVTPAPTLGAELSENNRTFLPTEEYVRTIGRTQMQEDTLWLVHSGTGVEFSVTGRKISISFRADSSCLGNADGKARIAIYVNGERVADEMINKLEKTVTVFESETEETCIVRVVKLSEAANSTVGISQIDVISAEDIQPTETREKLIEFVGDSITCGYGVDDEVKEHHFSTKTEDVTKTYAYKTAENLGADYSMVSFSGYGIISGYTGNGEKVADQILPQYYDKLGFSCGAYFGKYSPQEVTWDFTKRQPDLVVINLGTNDSTYVLGKADRKEEYTVGYVEFLKKVRELNPEATILCTLGIMGGDLYPSIEDAVERYQTETGDANIYSMQFSAQSYSDGYAADWHPTEATHTKAAKELTEKIKEIMGW
ncbi:MAG: GDSL-type esterase/lipase family protein [Lachnospiraceae bacterium]